MLRLGLRPCDFKLLFVPSFSVSLGILVRKSPIPGLVLAVVGWLIRLTTLMGFGCEERLLRSDISIVLYFFPRFGENVPAISSMAGRLVSFWVLLVNGPL